MSTAGPFKDEFRNAQHGGYLMSRPAGPASGLSPTCAGRVADALDARFNPVSVQRRDHRFRRAASGHCYFSLKDAPVRSAA
jgi:hypothetical protein